MNDDPRYNRQLETLLASWEANASGAAGAEVARLDGVFTAVFPAGPERDVYNNAVLAGGLDAAGREAAIAAMEAAYAAAGVERFAAWTHEGDAAMRTELERRGYELAETTRAMTISLTGAEPRAPAVPGIEIGAASWAEYLDYLHRGFGLAEELLAGVDPAAYAVLAARRGAEVLATGLAFDHGGDCGVFNVSTLEPARRRGVGTALTARLLRDARERGCATASLQSTPVAERVYAALGFADLGRILELAPPG